MDGYEGGDIHVTINDKGAARIETDSDEEGFEQSHVGPRVDTTRYDAVERDDRCRLGLDDGDNRPPVDGVEHETVDHFGSDGGDVGEHSITVDEASVHDALLRGEHGRRGKDRPRLDLVTDDHADLAELRRAGKQHEVFTENLPVDLGPDRLLPGFHRGHRRGVVHIVDDEIAPRVEAESGEVFFELADVGPGRDVLGKVAPHHDVSLQHDHGLEIDSHQHVARIKNSAHRYDRGDRAVAGDDDLHRQLESEGSADGGEGEEVTTLDLDGDLRPVDGIRCLASAVVGAGRSDDGEDQEEPDKTGCARARWSMRDGHVNGPYPLPRSPRPAKMSSRIGSQVSSAAATSGSSTSRPSRPARRSVRCPSSRFTSGPP